MPRGSGMSPTRRRNRAKPADPAALAARLPERLRSMDGFPGPFAYLAEVRSWMAAQGVPVHRTLEEAIAAQDAVVVSPSDVAEAAGVKAVVACFKHRLSTNP